MHPRTRHRLIGLLLLLLLAAILAPLVLRSPDQVRVALDMTLPEAPMLETTELEPVIDEQEQESLEREIEADQQAVADAGQAELETPLPEERDDKAEAASGDQVEPRPEPQPDPEPEPEPKPAPAQNGTLPKSGFTVQVASFSDQANADALVERLREAGYNAYFRTQEQDGNRWQRVFVGPEIQRKDAEAMKQRLRDDKRFALDGLVRTFVP
ncbi:SPOR domain-containing protein [Alcanivorax sp. 24]|uniref:SPOR domain-containing protein n=1 Tax=Alcanivorax sp. 24 TaxID=2545266 RepID=UPI0010601125|nr:SPOR domain-containing protein [Alcanivorax sp. 24]